VVEEHWLVGGWPRETESFKVSFMSRDAILEGTLIESHRWEIRKAWMHSVLDLQSDWADTKADKSFEKGLV
jgi:hypothetical protein